MQCPCSQYYDEQELSEESCNEEDYGVYQCYKYLEKDQYKNLCSRHMERDKRIDCLCSKYLETKREKSKVKGKFGVAYVIQTPRDKLCKPFGWQIEFQDTPSQVDRNCQKMVKWVTCPPLAECSNVETNFLYYPEVCGELLANTGIDKCYCRKPPPEQCCIIEIPKVKCLPIGYLQEQEKFACCVCQTNFPKRENENYSCSHKQRSQKSTSPAKNKHICLNSKTNCTCLDQQFEKFILCNKCCKMFPKCTCGQSVRNPCYCQQKKLKCKCTSKNLNRESERNVGGMCRHCQKSKSYFCTLEEHICPSCGRVMEKNCYVKENCISGSDNDALDYVPRRDTSPKKNFQETKNNTSHMKAKNSTKPENEYKKDKSPTVTDKNSKRLDNKVLRPVNKSSYVETKTPKSENKMAHAQNNRHSAENPILHPEMLHIESTTPHSDKAQTENTGVNAENKISPQGSANQKFEGDTKKDDLKTISGEKEMDLINFGDETPEAKHEKKFSTKGNEDEPSLLERIKKAHHEQIHVIHPEVPL